MFRRKTPRKASQNSLGTLLIAAFVVFDAGLALLAWQRWERGRLERAAVTEERELMVVPASEEPLVPVVTELPKPRTTPLVPRNSRGERAMPRLGALRPQPFAISNGAGSAAASSPVANDPAVRDHLPRAAAFYRELQDRPKYRELVNAWTEEFVKHRQLRVLNHRYHQDHDAAAFILGAVRSPEFLHLLGSFAARADLQGFMMEMTGHQDVSASAQALMRDGSVAKAMGEIRFPGMPPLAAIGAAAQRR